MLARISVLSLVCFVSALKAGADNLDIIQFQAPQDWTCPDATRNDTRIFVAPGSTPTSTAAILIVAGAPAQGEFNFRSNFDQLVKSTLQNREVTESGEVTASKTRQGYESLSQTLSAADANKNSIHVWIVAASVNSRLAAFCFISNDKALFDKHQPAMTQFLRTVSFGQAAVAKVDLARINAEREEIRAQMAKLQARLAELDALERGQAGATPAATAISPFKSPAEVLKDEEARRKPGIVSGNIYNTQAKPFNLKDVKAEIVIFGTTAAGERTSFHIPVDANGHYEMEIPKGIYRMHAQAIFPFNGDYISEFLYELDDTPSDDYDLQSGKGIVKDYALKLWGDHAGGGKRHGYFGASITLKDGTSVLNQLATRYPKGTTVHVLLAPTSPLLDGSKGQPIDCVGDLERMQIADYHSSIPYANYRATAKIVTPDGKEKPCKISLSALANDYAPEVEIRFKRKAGSLMDEIEVPYVQIQD